MPELTDAKIKAAKPKATPYKLADRDGLVLLVKSNGAKGWRFRYRYLGREKMIAMGHYPETTLRMARDKVVDARRLLAASKDPSQVRQSELAAAIAAKRAAGDTFEVLARDWFADEKKNAGWKVSHSDKVMGRLVRWVFPVIGRKHTKDVTTDDLKRTLDVIVDSGKAETARRVRQYLKSICAYAIGEERVERDVSAVKHKLRLPAINQKHHATILEPRRIGQLLRDIENYTGVGPIVKAALRVSPYLMARPGEVRKMEWSELSLNGRKPEWRISAEKMKMGKPHIVPLSTQAISILRAIETFTGDGKYVFPGARISSRPMSENTVVAALRAMGYSQDTMSAHGFRSMASTLMNEAGVNRDWIERQLAHTEQDEVRAAYNHAEYLSERSKLMQRWGDYLDELRAGSIERFQYDDRDGSRR